MNNPVPITTIRTTSNTNNTLTTKYMQANIQNKNE